MGGNGINGRDPRNTNDRVKKRTSGLTPRQHEVVRLAANGRTARQSARALGLSARTVENYLEQARQRTGAASTAELVAWAVSTGLVAHAGLVPGPERIRPGLARS